MANDPPESVDEFADQILILEGLGPAPYNQELRKALIELIAAAFEKHYEDEWQKTLVDSLNK